MERMDAQPHIESPQQTNPDIAANKDSAALSYAWILAVFIFFWKKDSPYVRFHARQALVLFILSLLLWPIPYVGHYLDLAVLALCILGFLNAADGKQKSLPVIGSIATGRWSQLRFWHRASVSAKKVPAPVQPNKHQELSRVAPPISSLPDLKPVQPTQAIQPQPTESVPTPPPLAP